MLRRAIAFAFEKSLFLVLGALVALIWANVDLNSYHRIVHAKVVVNLPVPIFGESGSSSIDLHSLTNDILMAFFFALAAKQIWEATQPGGPFHDLRHAAATLIATLGGMTGPAVLFVLGAALVGRLPELERGWAIPCATDVAFSYMIARLVFGRSHPAIPFLLLLAVADDFGGLTVLAVFYTGPVVHLQWLALSALAVLVGLAFKRLRIHAWWWYLLGPGVLSWLGFALAGLRPALGLLPIIPTLPHVHIPTADGGGGRPPHADTLKRFHYFWKKPVELILGLFGFMNAGVAFATVGELTLIVALALILGKPLGIWSFGMFSSYVLRLRLPQGLSPRDLLTVGCAAGIGFTVALFVTGVAFPPGPIQDAAKMGSLASVGAAITTLLAAWLLRRHD